MERALGHSFAGVRVHADEPAAALSRDLAAHAFTIGPHVAFGAGELRPGTPHGDALLAHELAHVVQQGTAAPAGDVPLGAAHDPLERDADAAAAAAVEHLHRGIERAPQRHLSGSASRGGPRLQRCGSSQAQPRTAISEPTREHAQAIIQIARDTARSEEPRAIAVVRAIIDTYYPGDAALVRNIIYSASEPGLMTTSVGRGDNARGDITVGTYFVTHTDDAGLARRVLQVGHELQHIRQYRAGMTGHNRRHEREFLAFHWEAMAPERRDTGQVSHATRVSLIDAALGHFYCLDADLQRQYARQRDELLAARTTHQRASGHEATSPPTTCAP
jgi:hypothetical protein